MSKQSLVFSGCKMGTWDRSGLIGVLPVLLQKLGLPSPS